MRTLSPPNLAPCPTPEARPGLAPALLSALLLGLLPALAGCAALKPDSLVSAAMERECSVQNLNRGQPYCRPAAAAPEPPPFCTRSRGSVDCWRQPPLAQPPYRGVGDTPAGPPPEAPARPLAAPEAASVATPVATPLVAPLVAPSAAPETALSRGS